MTRPEMFYYMEAEGLDSCISTRQSRINAAIKDFRTLAQDHVNINDYFTQEAILGNHGLSLDDLTNKDKDYIRRKVGA